MRVRRRWWILPSTRLTGNCRKIKKIEQIIFTRSIFKTVESWFYAPILLKKLRTYRNKFISHAADENSRRTEPLDRLGSCAG